MNEEPPHPTTDDRDAWRAYWQALGMPWRTEPEIDEERRAYLTERRNVTPNIERGIYPFRDESGRIKLDRADVEWLLTTHESGGMRGPIDWEETSQRKRGGVDVRGANISGVDLSHLPLARLHGGFGSDEFASTSGSQHLAEAAAVRLEHAQFVQAHLEGSTLTYATLGGATLTGAHLEAADLFRAHFEAERPGSLVRAVFDGSTVLREAVLANARHVSPSLLDVQWGGANLTTLDWAAVQKLGDEYRVKQRPPARQAQKDSSGHLRQYQLAVRATRQLATVLRDQGLQEDADRFAYRAQVLQRQVLWRQGSVGRWLFSWLLAALSGYGYRLWRILAAYVLTLVGFALAFYLAGLFTAPHLTPYEAAIVSFTAIHGRVFLGQFGLDSTLSLIAGIEAVFGIVIEGVFVAMLVQRFFAR